MTGRRIPLTSEIPFPRSVVNIATVAESEDKLRMTPGRTGSPLDLFRLEGRDAPGTSAVGFVALVVPEIAEMLELL